MFSQNQTDIKLEWMYKGPHSTVDREEYLLGKSVDKPLEQLNAQEKQQQSGVQPPKNHVEHECIPPSIRDYKEQIGEQVDINSKLQEDPLIAIKKREEENRRQFLNNPIQIKKLQKALKLQKTKKKKRKHSDSGSDDELDKKLAKKLKSLKSKDIIKSKSSKTSNKDILDTILMHKYNQLKNQLSNTDIRDILEGKKSETSSSGSGDSESSDSEKRDSSSDRSKKRRDIEKLKFRSEKLRKRSSSPDTKRSKHIKDHRQKQRYRRERSESRSDYRKEKYDSYKHKQRNTEKSDIKPQQKLYSSSKKEEKEKKYSSDSSSDSDSHTKKKNWGLVRADGTKLSLTKNKSDHFVKEQKLQHVNKYSSLKKREVLTEEEKEKRRREMAENASWRDKERARNMKLYRETNSKEDDSRKEYKPEFLKKELLKSANNSSVESRIKANINNIQRSGNDMSKHFSKRY